MARYLLLIFAIVLIGVQWAIDPVQSDQLILEVPKVRLIPWLESHFTYLYLHLFTLIPVLALSFDRRVRYFKSWKFLIPAILIIGTVFILWDVFFTYQGVWGFNHKYLTGVFLLKLPLEEYLFFLNVPFACVFIYECLNYYIKKDLLAPYEKGITWLLIISFLAIGLASWSRMYTFTTFTLAGIFLLYHYFFISDNYRSRFYLAYLVSWIPFLIVNGVLTGGYTKEPVVVYNPEEYLGIRITSVPLDDSVYSFLLLMSIITLYEFFQKKFQKSELS